MRLIVFAGPSLHGTAALAATGLYLAPPAKCGDVMQAALAGYDVIGLIDGVFESGPAVWHKEILFALELGCRVFGAASMGALRAAECWPFGMTGIGAIFEDYRTARRTADADVALVHGPAETNYLPLTIPLVDVADIIARMLNAGIIDAPLAMTLDDLARNTYFKSRTWQALLSGAGLSASLRASILQWIEGSGPAAKARDALLLIERLAHLAKASEAAERGSDASRVFGALIKPESRGAPTGAFMHTQFSARLLQGLGG